MGESLVRRRAAARRVPSKWVEGIFTRVPDQPALVHPDARGHRNAADHVAAAMPDVIGVS
ncbi:hypothetical protein [Streptomyces atratus]